MQISVILTFISIFISGVNKDTAIVAIIVSLLATSLGLISLLKNNKKIVFPKNFALMIIFTLILHVYVLFVKEKLNPFYFASTIGQGLLYWLIYYNFKNGDFVLRKIFILLTVTYSLLFFVSKVFDINLIKLSDLLFGYGGKTRHWDIGDLSAIVLVALIGLDWGKFKPSTIIIIGLNIVLLTLSNVRSAFLSLGVGIGYIFYKKDYFSKFNKYTSFLVLLLVAGLFIISSQGKTTLFDRPYFFQSIMSLPKHPLGIGVGNFDQIATNYLQNGTDGTLLATTTFNIFFEVLSGIGLFSVIFLIFLINVISEVLSKNIKVIAWGAVTLAILVNFMFDAAYLIPGFIWILFMSLGTFQSQDKLEAQ